MEKQVMKRLFTLLFLSLIAVNARAEPKLLSETRLFTEIAKDCHPVDLKNWSHPTLKVLKKYDLKLDALDLCNNDTYPIFYTVFKYDVSFNYEPSLMRNNHYFLPLEYDMARANSWHSYSIVDRDRKEMLNIKVNKKKRSTQDEYDRYF
ncbi:hypothetical protein [Aquirhabdus sp.]|uniref:hypothetical protein n=1 Tax=Aquirhabdus sp. TaxID=2824160 RepID=UPI00396C9CF7